MQNVNWVVEISRILGIVIACGTLIKIIMSNTQSRIASLESAISKKRDAMECTRIVESCPMKIKSDSYNEALVSIQDQLKTLGKDLKQEVRDLRIALNKHTDYHMNQKDNHHE